MRVSRAGEVSSQMAPRSPDALVTPQMLTWARESIGMSLEVAAHVLKLNAGRVERWEAGVELPTIVQLREVARVYKRPLAVFYLAEPPAGWDVMRVRDFRRVAGSAHGAWSPALHGEYQRAVSQHEVAVDLLEAIDEPVSVGWRVGADAGMEDESLAQLGRATLQMHAPFPIPTGPDGHFDYWSAALEEAGVLLMASSGVARSEMRGMSLYFDKAPVIMVNGRDFPRGRLFSALHEYAHLVLQSSGLCDQVVERRATKPDRRLEARCNRLAAAILMPASAVRSRPLVSVAPSGRASWSDADLHDTARPFGVSNEAMLRRLVTLGRATEKFYAGEHARLESVYELAIERQDEQRERDRQRGKQHGSFPRTHVRDLGKGYVRLVIGAYRQSTIDTYRAATLLDAPVRSIAGLAEAAALRAPK